MLDYPVMTSDANIIIVLLAIAGLLGAPHFPLHALPEDIEKYEGKYEIGWDSLRILRYEKMRALGIIDSSYSLSPREEGVKAWESAENKEDWAKRMAVYAAMIDRMDHRVWAKFLNR